ncbi:uncharacterized protein LOC116275918 isoform X3 [Papio anubis]|uniref:uncharacterized protein LOC116275918 isoform X3 n=1 Tax=Papio anubis TaxID=9555 RepID=UPI0012ADF3D8|nr:uncharacterized protein LOC116275918 isoform X3 [Papio anubis]XP_031524867.1 uncharacterized protein LOC116275918 isoform X3 [Papio anubis]XP_031524868.1 uncharacterized protein LOC116275918 isoform X3 [Papio anubis]
MSTGEGWRLIEWPGWARTLLPLRVWHLWLIPAPRYCRVHTMLQAHCLGSPPRFQGVGWCSKPQFPHCGGDAAGGMRIIEHSLAASVPAGPADLGYGTGRLPHQGWVCTLTCPHWGLRGSVTPWCCLHLSGLEAAFPHQPLVSISVIPALEHRPPTEGTFPQRARGQTAAALRAPGEAECTDSAVLGGIRPLADTALCLLHVRPQELPAGTGLPCHTVSLQPVRECPGRAWRHRPIFPMGTLQGAALKSRERPSWPQEMHGHRERTEEGRAVAAFSADALRTGGRELEQTHRRCTVINKAVYPDHSESMPATGSRRRV